MNILLFTHDDPIYMPQYLEPVLKAHRDDITEVILAPASTTLIEEIRTRYRMFGPKAFMIFAIMYGKGKLFDVLPAFLLSSLTGRLYSVKTVAKKYDLPIKQVKNINKPSFVEYVRSHNPDLILSIACGQRLQTELLDIPEKGSVNVHGSLLPKYRGLATSFWVLYYGENESGVTAHYMTSNFDTGDILIQRRYDIESDDTMHDVYLKLIETGSKVAIDLINQVKNGTVDPKPNPVEEGEYYSTPSKEDRKRFRERGNEFI